MGFLIYKVFIRKYRMPKYIVTNSQIDRIAENLKEQSKIDLTKVDYKNLNSKQQESYNFHKVSAILADYGYFPIRLSDDWQSADFLCQKCTDHSFIKVQLKGRLTFSKKYLGKDLFICFQDKNDGQWYLYSHDDLLNNILEDSNIGNTSSWIDQGQWSNNKLTKKEKSKLERYKL